MPRGAFGPRLQAALALLCGRYRLSRREAAAVSEDVLGAPVAAGSVDELCRATAAALAQPVAELEEAVRQAAVAHADETGWRQAGRRHWLWVVVTAAVTVFRIAASRGRGVIKGLLGEAFVGRLVSDRWLAYTWLAPERRQVCWAHLRRVFAALLDWGPKAAGVGRQALALCDRLFDAWHQARDEPAGRQRLLKQVQPIQQELRALLEAGRGHPTAKVVGLCDALLKLWPALWTCRGWSRRITRPSGRCGRRCCGARAASGRRATGQRLRRAHVVRGGYLQAAAPSPVGVPDRGLHGRSTRPACPLAATRSLPRSPAPPGSLNGYLEPI